MAIQLITYFDKHVAAPNVSEVFQNPINNDVHPLVVRASKILQEKLSYPSCGVMFGVLVVTDVKGNLGFLSAFDGELNNNDLLNPFVPLLKRHTNKTEYVVTNGSGVERRLFQFFKHPNYLENIGECPTIKLLQYAVAHSLKPLAGSEFWWGGSPTDKVRHHGYYYPACRGKCAPILPFLLTDIPISPIEILGHYEGEAYEPEILFEDDYLLVVNKPAGLLSVPGKDVLDSVITRLKKRSPNLPNLVLLHRLDLATSGLLIVAKTVKANRIIQKQFIHRTIEKRYVAILSLDRNQVKDLATGSIDLPLRVDIEDRPRQMVCHTYGKSAVTNWENISNTEDTARVYFYPVTGRTHQLRVHAAHRDGLNSPIVGDILYGKKANRLMLHAERIRFSHPASAIRIEINSPVPF